MCLRSDILIITSLVLAGTSTLWAADAENTARADRDTQQEWGKAVEGFRLSVSTETNIFQVGATVTLHVTFKNVGEEAKGVNLNSAADFDITVMLPDEEGMAPLTLRGKHWQESNLEASQFGGLMEAGQENRFLIDVDRLYDMTQEGTYRIWLSRRVHKRGNPREFATLISNTIEIRQEGRSPFQHVDQRKK